MISLWAVKQSTSFYKAIKKKHRKKFQISFLCISSQRASSVCGPLALSAEHEAVGMAISRLSVVSILPLIGRGVRNYPENSPSFSTLTEKCSTAGSGFVFLRPGKHWQINPKMAFNLHDCLGMITKKDVYSWRRIYTKIRCKVVCSWAFNPSEQRGVQSRISPSQSELIKISSYKHKRWINTS